MYSVRPVKPSDTHAWLKMRSEFWRDGSESEHAAEIEAFFNGSSSEPAAVLVAESEPLGLVGFAELSIRACAEGCRTNRVGYLEGWFVMSEARGRGVGRALLVAAEEWARTEGCSEFASDAHADSEASVAAHLALGFSDAGLIRCFRKDL
jgi:aminoglycoside 6'-N-acetyltransferase I